MGAAEPSRPVSSPPAVIELPVGGGPGIALRAGTILALCGENGAGFGAMLHDVTARILHHRPARDAGPTLALVTRSRSITTGMDVTENVFLGGLRQRRIGPVPIGFDWAGMRAETARLLSWLGGPVSPTAPAGALGELDRILVELARARRRAASAVVLHEPTALLNAAESARLIAALGVLRDDGIAVLVLTQKPRQALGYADAVLVARDGVVVAQHPRAEWEAAGVERVRESILHELVDRPRPALPAATREPASPGPELLRISGWSTYDVLDPTRPVVQDADLTVGAGEIVGLAGVGDSGAELLLLSVYGGQAGTDSSGSVFVRGERADTSTVESSIAAGLFFVGTESPRYRMRIVGGLVVPVPAGRVRGLASMGMVERDAGLTDGGTGSTGSGAGGEMGRKALDAVRSISRDGDAAARVRGLVREFPASDRLVLFLDEPFRGLAPAERDELLADLDRARAAGKGVVLLCSDLALVLAVSDRVLTMSAGRITGELPAGSPPASAAALMLPD